MTIEDLKKLTRTEISAFLKSRPNVVAGKALEAIRAGKSFRELHEILSAEPHSKYFWVRAERNPRKCFIPISLVDACGDSLGEFGEISRSQSQGSISVSLGMDDKARHIDEKSLNRIGCLRYLLEKNYPSGSNGWRGEFLTHVVSYWLSHLDDKFAEGLAKVVIDHRTAKGKSLLQCAGAVYDWNRSVGTVEVLRRLGTAKDLDEALDAALRYLNCSENPNSDPRLVVLKALMDTGAAATDQSMIALRYSSNYAQKKSELSAAGLLHRIYSPCEAELLKRENAHLESFAESHNARWLAALGYQGPEAERQQMLDKLRPVEEALNKAKRGQGTEAFRAFAAAA